MYRDFVILISADAEWRVVVSQISPSRISHSPYGNWFEYRYSKNDIQNKPVIFFHGGWGKVAAAGSTQYVITRWKPKLVVNIGTCGGFANLVSIGDVILAERTVIYDIYEQMGDPDTHVEYYSTNIDNSWLHEPLPIPVIRTRLVSADRDLFCEEISSLHERFGAIAGDWESGAIAWIAEKNHTSSLVLRGVTDLVSEKSGEAYNGNLSIFYQNTEMIMTKLLESLPMWLAKFLQREPDHH
jgi:adenosylhomocysteine nucleosidase